MLDQNLYLYIILFSISMIVSFYLNGLINKIYLNRGLIDQITLRSSHNSKVTRTGGIALFLVITALSLSISNLTSIFIDVNFWIALSLIILLGALDDIFTLTYRQKFIFQVFIGFILTQSGFFIDSFFGVFGFYEIPRMAAILTSIIVYVIIVNSMNLIDGIDGLSTLLFIYPVSVISLFIWGLDLKLFILIPIIVGSMCAFLWFNLRRRRKVFLGDAGSLLVGTFLSFFVFWLLSSDHVIATDSFINRGYFATLLLIYPLTDTLRAFTLRILNKKSPFSADRIHLHHRLLNKGYTHIYASLLILLLSVTILIINLLWFSILGLFLAPIATVFLMVVFYYYFF
jgi:UDP-N-acetylmuramyl pentapeptide phosphotransferase/UDP-N-acetylglucosamine-1-phosphate transferase